MRGYFIQGTQDDLSDIVLAPTVTEITDITFGKENIKMNLGDIYHVDVTATPADNNDVILWSAEDPTVAAVYNGIIRARGIGTTTIHARSQSGNVDKTILVKVYADQSVQVTSITTDQTSYEISVGVPAYLNATADSEKATLSYCSTNPDVVTVSALGKLVGVSSGSANIIITASTGLTKIIPVKVSSNDRAESISLALNVYYNDAYAGYYSNEVGTPIEITGDGQYTATFDCTADLSAAATTAGVTSLTNLTAVYLKDEAVAQGKEKKTPLSSCNIMFDEVIVDGVNMTITQTEPKSALKSSGILDTNDPLNSWDGSQVEEVTVTDHVLNITAAVNPKKITVVFTLSDVVFEEIETVADTVAVNSLSAPQEIAPENGFTGAQVQINVEPQAENAKLTVVSSDASIATVSQAAILTDASGIANVTVYGMNEGSTTLTVLSENGTATEIPVTVTKSTEAEEDAAEQKPATEQKTDSNTIFWSLQSLLL